MPRQYTSRSPIIPIGPSTAYLPLTQDQYALIDSDMAEELGKQTWFAYWHARAKSFYAHSNTKGRKRTMLSLHRSVFAPIAGFYVDHINRNTLDNRRCNLRYATHGENVVNSKLRSDNHVRIQGRCALWKSMDCMDFTQQKATHVRSVLNSSGSVCSILRCC